MSQFTHLHTHSHYSLLSALPKIDDLVAEAKKLGMKSLAITDNGNLYGAIDFYQACKKKEIKPIIGVDFYVAARTRKDMQAGIDNRRTRLVLLAMNDTGYKNLIKLVTDSNLEGFYYKPRIDRELIEKYSEGLIAISPSFSGEIAQSLKSRNQDKAKEVAAFYKKIFSRLNLAGGAAGDVANDTDNRLFIEITHHPEIDGHEENMKVLYEFAKSQGIPVMAAHDVYYLHQEDRFARETLLRVNSHSDSTEKVSDGDEDDFSFISPERATELFKDMPEAIENTEKIAERCNVEITLGKWIFPNYIVEDGLSYDDELRKISYAGLDVRGLPHTKEIIDRLEYELKVIKDKGYPQYFLVVSDLLRFSKENGIFTNIRGSVAGSLVTYVTGITKVNPIEYKLPFERFLNPERPSAPDIDMDYADNRRDDVIRYARQKYGNENVAQIGTFGTMMARGACRDVARAMGYPLPLADKIAKLVPMGAQGFAMTLDRALDEVPELKEMYDKDKDTKVIIDMARKIEGCARHISVHAAGVVIAPTPLTNYVPLQYDPKGEGKIITQYDMYGVGEDGVGLLKFDFLGIKNLSILADAVDRVKKIENIDLDIEAIPLDDKRTFEMLARGETIGLFQLNGSGLTKYLKDLKPTTIHDINAMVALYRPGPIESIPEYIDRKQHPEKIKYLDPRLKEILDQSYGVITYQDDVMLTAIKLAGYSWLEADKLRKAMGKKIPAEMEAQKEKLLKGFVAHGLSDKKAQTLWKLIEPFAAYGFNKAHAASYGRVAYQTSYLKANFPAIYMSAVLTADSGDIEKIGEFMAECKRMGMPVLPPSINESFSDFTVVKTPGASVWSVGDDRDKIRFGLTTIKNFGDGISKIIIHERKANGKFKTLSDFLERIQDRNLNKKSLEALIKTGAMDEYADRGVLLANLEGMLKYNKEVSSGNKSQDSLFSGLFSNGGSTSGTDGANTTIKPAENFHLEPAEKATMKEKLAWEKELLGLYVSGHPLEEYRAKIEKNNMNIKKALETSKEGASVIFAAIINEIRLVQTKKNETMAFIVISDFSGTAEAVVFPRSYKECKDFIVVDKCLAIKATVNLRNEEKGFVLERVRAL